MGMTCDLRQRAELAHSNQPLLVENGDVGGILLTGRMEVIPKSRLIERSWTRTNPNKICYHTLEPTMNLTANASRLGLRIQETFSEHARELNLSVSSNAALFDTPEAKINDIRRQLDGSNDRETLEGLKRLIAVGVLRPLNGQVSYLT